MSGSRDWWHCHEPLSGRTCQSNVSISSVNRIPQAPNRIPQVSNRKYPVSISWKSKAQQDIDYCQISNIRHTLVDNNIVFHSEVVGALPVGTAPTTSSFSTWHLASMDWAKTPATWDEKHLSLGIWWLEHLLWNCCQTSHEYHWTLVTLLMISHIVSFDMASPGHNVLIYLVITKIDYQKFHGLDLDMFCICEAIVFITTWSEFSDKS